MLKASVEKSSVLGLLLVVGYVVLSATKDIVLDNRLRGGNPADYLLLIFGFATVIYWVWGLCSASYRIVGREGVVKYLALLNVVTLGNWVGLYYALKYLNAPAVSALYAGVIPFATIVANRVLRSNSPIPRCDYWGAGSLIVCSLIWLVINYREIIGSHAYVGVICVVVSSLTIAFTTVVSKKLSEFNASTMSVMSNRFYLLIVCAMFTSSPLDEVGLLAVSEYKALLFVGVAGTVLSLWLLQKGIEKTDPVITNIIVSTTPVVTFAIYPLFFPGQIVNVSTGFISLLAVLIGVVSAGHRLRSNGALGD
ncbi:MAG: hypothetical protein JWQ79_4119 [Mucilaginibacter sp.]|nr:hypothetical protein [Mucilaginibacter sp.]